MDEQRIFLSKQNYNNNENKFKLNEYETELEEQLITDLINDILIYLANI